MSKQKIINSSILSIYFKRYLKRGQITFNNSNDAQKFICILEKNNIDFYHFFLSNNVIICYAKFFPFIFENDENMHYIQSLN